MKNFIDKKVTKIGGLFILHKIRREQGMKPWYRNVEASIIGKLDAQEQKLLKKQDKIRQNKSVKKRRGGDM